MQARAIHPDKMDQQAPAKVGRPSDAGRPSGAEAGTLFETHAVRPRGLRRVEAELQAHEEP